MKCVEGTHTDGTTYCSSCGTGCKTCIGASACSDCQVLYEYSSPNNNCIACADGKYSTGASGNTCTTCTSNCKTCATASTCATCNTNYGLSSGSCNACATG